jgi:hypothetical protein
MAVRAVALLWVVRLGLWVLPFSTLRRWLPTVARFGRGWSRGCELSAERVGWAVAATARYVPAATCLVRALVADRLLGELSLPSEMRVGVAKDGRARMQAHAWIMSGPRVIVGGAEVARFRTLQPRDTSLGAP